MGDMVDFLSAYLEDNRFIVEGTITLNTHKGKTIFKFCDFIIDTGAETSLICSNGLALSDNYIEKWEQYDKKHCENGYVGGIESTLKRSNKSNVVYIHKEARIIAGNYDLGMVPLRVSHILNCDFLIGMDILGRMRFYADYCKTRNKLKFIGAFINDKKVFQKFLTAFKEFDFISLNLLYTKDEEIKTLREELDAARQKLKEYDVQYNPSNKSIDLGIYTRDASVKKQTRGSKFDKFMSIIINKENHEEK